MYSSIYYKIIKLVFELSLSCLNLNQAQIKSHSIYNIEVLGKLVI